MKNTLRDYLLCFVAWFDTRQAGSNNASGDSFFLPLLPADGEEKTYTDCVLYDSGFENSRRHIISGADRHNYRTVGVIISHWNIDHYGGFISLLGEEDPVLSDVQWVLLPPDPPERVTGNLEHLATMGFTLNEDVDPLRYVFEKTHQALLPMYRWPGDYKLYTREVALRAVEEAPEITTPNEGHPPPPLDTRAAAVSCRPTSITVRVKDTDMNAIGLVTLFRGYNATSKKRVHYLITSDLPRTLIFPLSKWLPPNDETWEALIGTLRQHLGRAKNSVLTAEEVYDSCFANVCTSTDPPPGTDWFKKMSNVLRVELIDRYIASVREVDGHPNSLLYCTTLADRKWDFIQISHHGSVHSNSLHGKYTKDILVSPYQLFLHSLSYSRGFFVTSAGHCSPLLFSALTIAYLLAFFNPLHYHDPDSFPVYPVYVALPSRDRVEYRELCALDVVLEGWPAYDAFDPFHVRPIPCLLWSYRGSQIPPHFNIYRNALVKVMTRLGEEVPGENERDSLLVLPVLPSRCSTALHLCGVLRHHVELDDVPAELVDAWRSTFVGRSGRVLNRLAKSLSKVMYGRYGKRVRVTPCPTALVHPFQRLVEAQQPEAAPHEAVPELSTFMVWLREQTAAGAADVLPQEARQAAADPVVGAATSQHAATILEAASVIDAQSAGRVFPQSDASLELHAEDEEKAVHPHAGPVAHRASAFAEHGREDATVSQPTSPTHAASVARVSATPLVAELARWTAETGVELTTVADTASRRLEEIFSPYAHHAHVQSQVRDALSQVMATATDLFKSIAVAYAAVERVGGTSNHDPGLHDGLSDSSAQQFSNSTSSSSAPSSSSFSSLPMAFTARGQGSAHRLARNAGQPSEPASDNLTAQLLLGPRQPIPNDVGPAVKQPVAAVPESWHEGAVRDVPE